MHGPIREIAASVTEAQHGLIRDEGITGDRLLVGMLLIEATVLSGQNHHVVLESIAVKAFGLARMARATAALIEDAAAGGPLTRHVSIDWAALWEDLQITPPDVHLPTSKGRRVWVTAAAAPAAVAGRRLLRAVQ